MNIKSLALVGVGALLSGCMTATGPAYDTLIAHRGESHDAPENTLPAYRMAVERGFGFECDIYLAKDKCLFTFHDRDLRRTTDGANTNRCTDVTWTDTVSKVNVGGWGKWKGTAFDPAVVDKAYVDTVKAAGFSFHVWTIDRPETAAQAFAAGADTLTTNRAKFILESCRK